MTDVGLLEQQDRPRAAVTREPLLGREPLLTLPDTEAAQRLFELWHSQEKSLRQKQQAWKANRLRRRGISGVALIRHPDTQMLTVYVPPGGSKQVPVLNKADRLCRLLTATIFADPPEPDCTPSSDQDSDRDAAEFATRVLSDLGAEGQLDTTNTARAAFDLANVYASTFRYYWVDPRGGGWQPLPLLASPQRTAPVQSPDDAITDPESGEAYPPPYVVRYLRADGTLTDDRHDPNTRRAWVPRIRCRILTGHHVRPIPPSAGDVWEAAGVTIGEWVTLDELRTRFPGKVPEDEDTLKAWVKYRPEHPETSYPGGKPALTASDQAPLSGDTPVFVLSGYYKQTESYPRGAYLVAVADEYLLHRQRWTDPQTGDPLDIPVDQIKQMAEETDFYGRAMMAVLGPAQEVRSSLVGSKLEHLDRFLSRKVFVPTTSTFQARAAQAMTNTYIPINPGGKPEYEQVPDFPAAVSEMFPEISAEMDHESGLEPPVTGQNPPSVQSSLHARVIIEQVHQGISDIRQNVIRALLRGWRIQLQLIKAFYTVPQRIGWVGDDGAYKEKLWTGADLGTTKDVRLHTGTLSMMTPSAKAAVAQDMFNVVDPKSGDRMLSLGELRRIVLGNVGGLIGLQDDPARQRIRRQVAQWSEGPPKGWVSGTPNGMQVLQGIWEPVSADTDPRSAMIRYEELNRLIASTTFTRWPPEWRQAVNQEWQRMQQAAGVASMQLAQQVQQGQQAQAQVQQLQQALQQAQQELQGMQQKLAAPHVSFAAKLADLDAGQTQALLAQEGIQLPPPAGTPPDLLMPLAQGLQQVHGQVQQLAAAHQAGAQDLAKVGQNVQRALQEHQQKLEQRLAQQPAPSHPPISVTVPVTIDKDGAPKIVSFQRDAEGKVQGAIVEPPAGPPA